MYKTVRKGDASLQYTILPQTDQYSSSGFPQSTADKTRLRLVKFAMASLVILVVLTCVATPFLLNDSDKGLLVGTVFAMSRHVGLTAVPRNSSERKTDESAATATTVTPSTHGYRIESIGTTARISASTGSTASSIASSIATSIASSTAGSTASSIASFTEESSTIVLVESSKARENDTMPQVYEMKAAGIGSHGLSLEGLIFKSPEGTIKPWPQKWFFGDSASKFQWKGLGQIPTKGFTVLTGLAILATVGLVLFYVQRRATRPHRQNDVEEPAAAEGQEEDESTLLGPEGQESEEKE